jgi:hypothetical protein
MLCKGVFTITKLFGPRTRFLNLCWIPLVEVASSLFCQERFSDLWQFSRFVDFECGSLVSLILDFSDYNEEPLHIIAFLYNSIYTCRFGQIFF